MTKKIRVDIETYLTVVRSSGFPWMPKLIKKQTKSPQYP